MSPLDLALDNGSVKLTLINHDLPITEQTVDLTEILLICNHIGKLLQLGDSFDSESVITCIKQEARKRAENGIPVMSMMLGEVAKGWEQKLK